LFLGLFIWVFFKEKEARRDDKFIGGEELREGEDFPATEFYKTLEDAPVFKRILKLLKVQRFDFYNILYTGLRFLSGILNKLTQGLAWVFESLFDLAAVPLEFLLSFLIRKKD